jgi:hypothetical protein
MQRLCIIYPQVPHTIQHTVLCEWTLCCLSVGSLHAGRGEDTRSRSNRGRCHTCPSSNSALGPSFAHAFIANRGPLLSRLGLALTPASW